jgi:hypothetical protein
MEFKLEHELDKGPIVRWFANKCLQLTDKIYTWVYPYADMYTAVWDDYEEDELFVPHNQMGIFDDLDNLPKFNNLKEDLI